jgi:hypothetical protein
MSSTWSLEPTDELLKIHLYVMIWDHITEHLTLIRCRRLSSYIYSVQDCGCKQLISSLCSVGASMPHFRLGYKTMDEGGIGLRTSRSACRVLPSPPLTSEVLTSRISQGGSITVTCIAND